MMNLTIETEDTNRAGDLENAYNIAMNTGTIPLFIQSLENNMPDTIIGCGANHIFIAEKTGKRIGLITNLFN